MRVRLVDTQRGRNDRCAGRQADTQTARSTFQHQQTSENPSTLVWDGAAEAAPPALVCLGPSDGN